MLELLIQLIGRLSIALLVEKKVIGYEKKGNFAHK